MGYTAAPLEKLIEEFSKFPGIGRKGATRMAYQVLSMSDEDAAALAGAIQGAHTKLHRCRICQNYTEADICPICASAKRDPSVICVVETPRDVQAFERTREYHGLYHVLHGLLSPMDGITAEQLCVKELLARLGDGKVKEVIMAMNPRWRVKPPPCIWQSSSTSGIKTTRLAYGLPVAQAWNTLTKPLCTVHFLAVVSCELGKIYNFFKNSPCKTIKKWYTDTTNHNGERRRAEWHPLRSVRQQKPLPQTVKRAMNTSFWKRWKPALN